MNRMLLGTVQTERRAGEALVVSLYGEHDLSTAALVASALESAGALGGSRVILDLRGMTFIDSSIVHVLAAAVQRPGGPAEIVVEPGGFVRHVLALTAVDRLAPVIETLESVEPALS